MRVGEIFSLGGGCHDDHYDKGGHGYGKRHHGGYSKGYSYSYGKRHGGGYSKGYSYGYGKRNYGGGGLLGIKISL